MYFQRSLPRPAGIAEVLQPVWRSGPRSLYQGLEIGKIVGIFGGCGGHEVSVSQCGLHARVNGFFDPVVALFFQLVGEFWATGPDDASVKQHVYVVGRDVV